MIRRADLQVDLEADVFGSYIVSREDTRRVSTAARSGGAENAGNVGGANHRDSTWRVGVGGVLVEVTKPKAAFSVPAQPGAGCEAPAPAGGRAAPLGNNADFAPIGFSPSDRISLLNNCDSGRKAKLGAKEVCGPVDIHDVLPAPATATAWYLRSYARQILSKAGATNKNGGPLRIRFCGARISRGKDGVGVYARPDRAYGRVHGVCVCGQSLACPVCAPRIAAFRAAEVSECFKRASALGYEARLETFTAPHIRGAHLGLEIDAFGEAWRFFGKGRMADELRKYEFGHHVGREVTYGAKNGWHYHHHRCRYDKPGTYDEQRVKFYWLAALSSIGRRSRGTDTHAFRCGVVGDAAHAEYVGKLATAVDADARAIGSEIASSATKGKNLATLLLAASLGDGHAAGTWREGVRCITERKVSSVRWSRGLAAKVGMPRGKEDKIVAEEEQLSTDVFLGALTPVQWRGVLLHRAEFVLCCAANQGRDAVNNFLAGIDCGQLDDDARPAVIVPLQDDIVYRGFPVNKAVALYA